MGFRVVELSFVGFRIFNLELSGLRSTSACFAEELPVARHSGLSGTRAFLFQAQPEAGDDRVVTVACGSSLQPICRER